MDFPTLVNAGISYTRTVGASLNLSIIANFHSNSFDQDQNSAALELGFLETLCMQLSVDELRSVRHRFNDMLDRWQ